MISRALIPTLLATLVALAAAMTAAGTPAAAEGEPVTPARLLATARAAIRSDHALAVRVLWTNTVPAKPKATAGPALAALRQAAAGRKRRGIRVRLLSERFRILTVRLDPTYTRATATVTDRQRLRPYRAQGGPLGKPVTLNEHATLTLHRVGRSTRFVVWKVT